MKGLDPKFWTGTSVMKHTYGLIGDGRLALQLQSLFEAHHIPYQHWSRRRGSRTDSPGDSPSLQHLTQNSSVILMAVKDSAITEIIQQISPHLRPDTILIHFSGSLVLSQSQPKVWGYHPLGSFTYSPLTPQEFSHIGWVIDQDAPDLKMIFPFLTNPSYRLAPELKPLYHALCVSAGNFTTLLWQETLKRFEVDLNLPRELLFTYLDHITRNLKEDAESALTGPFARRDESTLKSNLRALDTSRMGRLYQTFYDQFYKGGSHENRA